MKDLKYLSYPFSVIQPQKDALEIHLLTIDGFNLRTSAVHQMPIPLVTISNLNSALFNNHTHLDRNTIVNCISFYNQNYLI
jgi:folate-dependent tRNA-U54 methylase TrmFO/GidA